MLPLPSYLMFLITQPCITLKGPSENSHRRSADRMTSDRQFSGLLLIYRLILPLRSLQVHLPLYSWMSESRAWGGRPMASIVTCLSCFLVSFPYSVLGEIHCSQPSPFVSLLFLYYSIIPVTMHQSQHWPPPCAYKLLLTVNHKMPDCNVMKCYGHDRQLPSSHLPLGSCIYLSIYQWKKLVSDLTNPLPPL